MVLETGFPPDIRVEKEALSLIRGGHEVHIATVHSGKGNTGGKVTTELINGIIVHRKYIPGLTAKSAVGALVFPLYFRFWRKYLQSLFQQFRYNIVHIHDLPLTGIGRKLADRTGIKLISDQHENYPALLEISAHTKKLLGRLLHSDKQWRKFEKEALSRSDRVIAVIEEMKERLIKQGLAEEKITVVSNTVDPDDIQESGPDPDPRRELPRSDARVDRGAGRAARPPLLRGRRPHGRDHDP